MKKRTENCGNCINNDSGICKSNLSDNSELEISDKNWCVFHLHINIMDDNKFRLQTSEKLTMKK